MFSEARFFSSLQKVPCQSKLCQCPLIKRASDRVPLPRHHLILHLRPWFVPSGLMASSTSSWLLVRRLTLFSQPFVSFWTCCPLALLGVSLGICLLPKILLAFSVQRVSLWAPESSVVSESGSSAPAWALLLASFSLLPRFLGILLPRAMLYPSCLSLW